MLSVPIPQLRDAFDATTAQIALAIPAYMVPFAALQLISGTVGERLGRRRVVRAGYAGGTSVASAFKFAGNAAAPVVWLPLYHADARLGFLGAGVMALLSGTLVLPLRSVG